MAAGSVQRRQLSLLIPQCLAQRNVLHLTSNTEPLTQEGREDEGQAKHAPPAAGKQLGWCFIQVSLPQPPHAALKAASYVAPCKR